LKGGAGVEIHGLVLKEYRRLSGMVRMDERFEVGLMSGRG
jgi:hypothetical protein